MHFFILTIEYNEYGQRIKKYNDNSTTKYYYENDLLIRSIKDNVSVDYLRDITGNINKIVDSNGLIMVKYTYTAYGQVTMDNMFDTNNPLYQTAEELITHNIFLYKGYCYDVETGLALASSRYYSPELCRFIQPADVSSLNPYSINGLNLYAYANNNPIGKAKLSSITNVGTLSGFSSNIMIPSINILNVSSKTGNDNYWNPHVKGKWFDTDWSTFPSFSDDGFEAVNWSLSIYKGSLFFDNQENHSLYVSLGNISILAGLVFPKDSSEDNKTRFGFDASASVIEIGYDGRIIDASVSGLTIGATYLFKDGKSKLEYGYGWWGWSVSIDFIELFKWLFGGK